MRLFVNVKQVGTRKNHISKEQIILDQTPTTLRILIGDIVKQNVEQYNKRVNEKTIIDFITDEQLADKVEVGKVSFGEVYNENEAKLDKALECAWLAYEDGIYRVLIEDREAGSLDEALELHEDDVLTFIRLTMLAGKMW